MPCDYRKYPKNWKTEIRPRILDRAQNKCEWCGVQNGFVRLDDESVVAPDSLDAFYAGENWSAGLGKKPRVIVLTIAHINDPNPMNCNDDNLAALCQRCHNRHDAPMRQINARATRMAKGGQLALGGGLQ